MIVETDYLVSDCLIKDSYMCQQRRAVVLDCVTVTQPKVSPITAIITVGLIIYTCKTYILLFFGLESKKPEM